MSSLLKILSFYPNVDSFSLLLGFLTLITVRLKTKSLLKHPHHQPVHLQTGSWVQPKAHVDFSFDYISIASVYPPAPSNSHKMKVYRDSLLKMEYSYPGWWLESCVGGWFQSKAYQHVLNIPMLYTTKNLRTIPTFFSNSTPDPMKSTPVTGRGTYIGHAELSYHGPCHAFHLLQVTTSTWHCLMDDSTLKLINFVFFAFLILVANIPWVSNATGHFCWDFWRPPHFETHIFDS